MSAMFTTCPSCKANLALTPMDLRIGQGYVRCGRCDKVFNALLSLAEDIDREQQSGLAAKGTTSVPALEDEMPEEDLPPPPAPQEAPEAPSNVTPLRFQPPEEVDVVETLATGTFETIVLEGDGFLQTEEHVDETEIDDRLQKIAIQMDADDLARLREELGDNLEVEELTGENVVIEAGEEQPEFDADQAVGNAPRTHWGWGLAAGLLVLLLAAQIVHHSRQSLVALAWAQRPLQAIYGVFGVKLEPRWDLKAYDLRQLGGEAQPGAGTNIVLRASVQNRATTSQPPPMIRVTLQDRFGNALTTTSVAPQDWLRGDVPSRMRPDQRLDAELTLQDPNKQAVGFELDACLPGAGGKLHCSTDP